MTNPFIDLLNLIYPDLCAVCGRTLIKGEKIICISCICNIPKTNYHLQPGNPVEKLFWWKVAVVRGSSFFFFTKGSPFQKLLHELKYKGNKEVGEVLGKYAGIDLPDSPEFCTVDIIVPVPLHPKKQAKRGYNQSEWIARGLASAMQKPIDTKTLVRIRENATQTRKTVFDRYENTQDIFALKDRATFSGKHILLVDDVLTTGATLEACIQALQESPDIKVSVFTLACA